MIFIVSNPIVSPFSKTSSREPHTNLLKIASICRQTMSVCSRLPELINNYDL